MSKKLIPACMALFALAAFILPATASAATPVLTHPTGTAFCPGGGCKITATGLNTQILTDTTGNKLLECSKASMTGTLTKNNGTEIEGNIETTTFGGTGALVNSEPECTGSFGNVSVDTNIGNGTPWCLRATAAMNPNEFQVRGGKCSEASRSITFVLTSTTAGTCKYNRTTAIRGTFTTHSTGDAILTTTGGGTTGAEDTGFSKEEGGILCPSSGTLDLSFTLETDSPTAEPMYIS